MIGSSISLNERSVRILRIISEGGYGFVYLVEDEARQRFALKKVITQDAERYNLVRKELRFMEEHARGVNPHFIGFIDSKIVQSGKHEHTFFILLEFGAQGTLFDAMARRLETETNFSETEIVDLLSSAARALRRVHELGFVYCDMKIENCLYFDPQTVKLCDFGSVNQFDIDFAALPKSQHYQYEEVFEKETTLMYRPPEMCDLYLQYRVNTQADMWMLGCVAYTLMFFKHPFAEASKLAITTAAFNWPAEPVYSEKLETLVRNLLTPNPALRPTAREVVDALENWAGAALQLNSMAADIKRERESKSNAIKHIGEGLPVRRVKNPNELGFDVFDFSGLNKMSRKSVTAVPRVQGKPLSNIATPNARKSEVLIRDDVFSRLNVKAEPKNAEFDFFADERSNGELELKFDKPTDYNFDCFADAQPASKLKSEFDDFLSFEIPSDAKPLPKPDVKPQSTVKPTQKTDLLDLDFCSY